jgi:hypothetical protein
VKAETETAAKPERVKKPNPNAKAQFVGGDKARLAVVLRRHRGGSFLTYVEHKPAGEPTVRGVVKTHDTLAAAQAEYNTLVVNAVSRGGWRERGSAPESAFSELPSAAPAVPKVRPITKAQSARRSR